MTANQNLLWHAGISTLRVWVAFLIAAAMAINEMRKYLLAQPMFAALTGGLVAEIARARHTD